jgi:hypothetical protein
MDVFPPDFINISGAVLLFENSRMAGSWQALDSQAGQENGSQFFESGEQLNG